MKMFNKGENEMTPMNYNYNDIMNALGQTVNIAKSNTESTQAVLAQMGILSKDIVNVKGSIGNLNDRMTNIELNEEITTEQNENILVAAKRRVIEILGDDTYEHQKYFRTFIMRLYKDTRQNASLGSKVARTRKRDYQRVINYMESWIPKGGCTNLKSYADNRAQMKKKAIENGYID